MTTMTTTTQKATEAGTGLLRSLKHLQGYSVRATDRKVGTIHDTRFDDESWVVQYFVVDTGNWLPGRKVLISPAAVGHPEWSDGVVPVQLTGKAIEDAPTADLDRPISAEYRQTLGVHHGWPVLWSGTMPGLTLDPAAPPPKIDVERLERSHLRSTREVAGYRIEATDGEIGHVEDFIAEEGSWAIRYLVVDTKNWLPGRKVLVAPAWVREIDWAGKQVQVDLERERIQNSPPFNPSTPVNREYEVRLYDYYGRPHYWA